MDSLGGGKGRDMDKGKTSRGRRSWSTMEEDALIRCLTNIVNDGWKVENGFKGGFQRELEKGMHRILPGIDILVNPYINSKIHVCKKEYSALSDLLSKSGIGWNSTTSMIEVEDEKVWDASRWGIRFKTWPYYTQWLEIYGKDRATGENAVNPMDLVNELLSNPEQEQKGDTDEKNIPKNPFTVNEGENNSVCKPEASSIKSGSKGPKGR
ncbi:hypothetical protein ACS0TY_033431 [Phlomoides rotata]